MPSKFRARRVCLTFWSPPDFKEDKRCTYFVSGQEICPDTKQVHYQSYAEFSTTLSLKAIKEIINDDKAHILKAKGNAHQNIAYCKKDDKVYREFGKPKQQGFRTDILAVRDHFKNGKRLRDAIDDDSLAQTVAKYPRFANIVELMYSKPRESMTELHIYWGATGAGKSHRAKQEGGATAYYKPLGKASQWWDGYEENEVVIIEDFRGEIPLSTLLRLADKYAMRVPVKGGFKQFNSKKIIITSNLSPEDWFNKEQKGYEASFAALQRRITSRVHYDSRWNPPQL